MECELANANGGRYLPSGWKPKAGGPWRIASGHAGATIHPIFTRRNLLEPKSLILLALQTGFEPVY